LSTDPKDSLEQWTSAQHCEATIHAINQGEFVEAQIWALLCMARELRTLNESVAKFVGIIAAYDLVLGRDLDARRAEEARAAMADAAAEVGM
jgi:hypothetical protein